MSVMIRCPKCHQAFEASGPGPEGRIECPHCHQRLRWPATVPASPAPEPAENLAPVRLVGRTAGPPRRAPAKPRSPGFYIAIGTVGVIVASVVIGLVYMAMSGGPATPPVTPVEVKTPAPDETAKTPPNTAVDPTPPPPPPPPPPPKSTAVVSSTDLDAAGLFAKASPAVARIEVLDSDFQKQGQGSGFVVSADGMVVTNYHVFRAGRRGLVRFGEEKAYPVVAVLAQDEKKDLAVLKINGAEMPYLEVLPKDQKPVIGARAFAIGTPAGYSNSLSEGLVSGLRDQEHRSVVQSTAPISSGSSGGPLMDARTRVIGANTYVDAGTSPGQVKENLNFAVSSKDIHEILTKAIAAKAKLTSASGGKPLDPTSMADLAQAYELIGKDKWLEAATLAQALRKKNPENVQALLLEGLLDVRLNLQDEVMKVYEAVVRLSPFEPEGHIGLGLAFLKKKMWKEAAETLERAVKLRPEDASAQRALGEALQQLGRKDEALDTLKEAVRLDDEVAPAWMALGEAYMANNLFGPAADAFRKAAHLRPNPMAWARLGMAAYENGQFEEAIQAAEAAIKMQPGLPEACYVLGLAYHRTGRKEQAEQMVEFLQKTKPELAKKLQETMKATPAAPPAAEKAPPAAEKKPPADEKKPPADEKKPPAPEKKK